MTHAGRRGSLALALVALVAGCDRAGTPAAPRKALSPLDMTIEPPRRGDTAAARAKVEQAQHELALHHFESALALGKEALVADPGDVDALLLEAAMLTERTVAYDLSRALVAYRTALVVDPRNVGARVGEAVVRVELEDDARALVLLNALAADEAAKQVELSDAQRAGVHRALAKVALRAGRFDEALREAELSLQARERDYRTLTLRAEVLERMEKFAEAEGDLELALQLRPEEAKAHFQRARVLRRLGRAADADLEARVHEALRPFDEDLSKAFQADTARRIALRRDLVAALPKERWARLLLVRELRAGKEWGDARAELQRLLAEKSDDLEAWQLLARTLAQSGDRKGAREIVERMGTTGAVPRAILDDLQRVIESGGDDSKR